VTGVAAPFVPNSAGAPGLHVTWPSWVIEPIAPVVPEQVPVTRTWTRAWLIRPEPIVRGVLLRMTRLDEAALVRPGVVGDWSLKDLIGHIAAWEHLVVDYLERWRRGSGSLAVNPDDRPSLRLFALQRYGSPRRLTCGPVTLPFG